MRKILSAKVLARSLIESGHLPNTHEYTSITSKAAKELVRLSTIEINLGSVFTISDSFAHLLSTFNGDICLSGLTRLSNNAAKSLANHVGWLKLSNIKHLSQEAIQSLGMHRGGLSLDSLERLSDQDAIILSKSIGGLSLSGLSNLSEKAVESLAQHDGWLHLGITNLSDSAASLLAQHKGRDLILDALTEISPDALCSLTKHIGNVELVDASIEIQQAFADIKYFRKHKTDKSFQKSVSTLKSYMIMWSNLGISEELEFYFSGSGDDGSVESYVSSETTNVLREHGYVLGWINENQIILNYINNNIMSEHMKKGILTILWFLLPIGWEINHGTSGKIILNTVLNKITIEYHLYREDAESQYLTYKWNEDF